MSPCDTFLSKSTIGSLPPKKDQKINVNEPPASSNQGQTEYGTQSSHDVCIVPNSQFPICCQWSIQSLITFLIASLFSSFLFSPAPPWPPHQEVDKWHLSEQNWIVENLPTPPTPMKYGNASLVCCGWIDWWERKGRREGRQKEKEHPRTHQTERRRD